MYSRPRFMLPALLFMALTPSVGQALDLDGDYMHLYYSADGVGFDDGVPGGYEVTLSGSTFDYIYGSASAADKGLVGSAFYYEDSAGTGTSYANYFASPDYTVDWTLVSETDTSSGGNLESTYEWTVGDLTVTRTETFAIDGLSVFVRYSVVNDGAAKLYNLQYYYFADPTRGTSTNTYNTTVDVEVDSVDDWVQAGRSGTSSGNQMGIGACDPDNDSVFVTDTLEPDPSALEAVTAGGSIASDQQLGFVHYIESLAVGHAANFGYVIAFGTSAANAQAEFDALFDQCLDLDQDGYEGTYGSFGDGSDCDESDADVNPGVSETWYDGYDQDCAGDDDYDADADGYAANTDADGDGVPDYQGLKTKDPGTNTNITGTGKLPATDCDDSDDDINPGASEEWYDGVDGDCGADTDFDADGDGYIEDDYAGEVTTDPSTGDVVDDGTSTLVGDCDDDNAATNPDGEEAWYDGYDGDCNGLSDYDADEDGYVPDEYEGFETSDGTGEVVEDGSMPAGDCDDADAAVNPAAEETWYDGVDEDCNGASDYDADEDGYTRAGDEGLETTDPGTGEVVDDGNTLDTGDCDDGNADTSPDSEEIWYDGYDGDCGGDDDFDQDGDGYVEDEYEGMPTTDSSGNEVPGTGEAEPGDCDDEDADVNPDADEVWYNGVDEDCDGNLFDQDGDGYPADGYDTNGDGVIDEDDGGDCDDDDDSVSPDSDENWYNGLDEDCGDDDDYDQDGDGFQREGDEGKVTVDRNGDPIPGTGETATDRGDCDDTDPDVYYGAEEEWYDGKDQDCDGLSDYDQDGDGVDADGYDTNGDGVIDETDGGDCDDLDVSVIDTCDADTGGVPFYKGGGGIGCATGGGGAAGGWLGALAAAAMIRRRKR